MSLPWWPTWSGQPFATAVGGVVRLARSGRGNDSLSRSDEGLWASQLLSIPATLAILYLCVVRPGRRTRRILSINQHAWPKDLQQRSYLTDFVCGDTTGRVCPGPGTPVYRQGSTPTPAPTIVPFAHLALSGR